MAFQTINPEAAFPGGMPMTAAGGVTFSLSCLRPPREGVAFRELQHGRRLTFLKVGT